MFSCFLECEIKVFLAAKHFPEVSHKRCPDLSQGYFDKATIVVKVVVAIKSIVGIVAKKQHATAVALLP